MGKSETNKQGIPDGGSKKGKCKRGMSGVKNGNIASSDRSEEFDVFIGPPCVVRSSSIGVR